MTEEEREAELAESATEGIEGWENGLPTFEYKGLKFIQTCCVCPEQYDVLDGRSAVVGYVRLRWGNFSCDYRAGGADETVLVNDYNENIGDGSFSTHELRLRWLRKSAVALKRRINEARKVQRS